MENKPTKLFNKNFLLLWQGQTISRFGSQFYIMAMQLWLYRETGSGTLIGNILLVSGIVAVIMGPIGATLSDRYSRKKIVIFGDVTRGILVLILTVLIFQIPQETNIIIIGIFIVAIYSAIIATLFGPALSASIPDMVPKEALQGANSMGQGAGQIATMVAQAAGGLLYPIIGAPLLFLFNGISFLYAAISEFFVTIPQDIPEKKMILREELTSFWDDLVEGFRYIIQRPGLRDTVLISAVMAFFTAPAGLLLLFFINDTLNVAIGWYGAVLSAYTLGILIGTIIAGVTRMTPQTRGKVILIFIFTQAIGYGIFGFVRNEYLVVVLGLLNGVVTGFILVYFMTIVQIATPSEKRGRVVGILATINGLFSPFAAGIAGRLVDILDKNVSMIFFASGIIMTVFVIFVSFNKNFREFLATENQVGQSFGDQEQANV